MYSSCFRGSKKLNEDLKQELLASISLRNAITEYSPLLDMGCGPFSKPKIGDERANGEEKYLVHTSAELMKNYATEDVLKPQKKFTALQTSTGQTLLFSINTDNEFTAVVESHGKTSAGWEVCDLSNSVFARFPTSPIKPAVTTFAAAQAPATANSNVHLSMVVTDGVNDKLYVSLGNSDSDLAWTKDIAWIECTFNAKDVDGNALPAPSPLKIGGVMISHAIDGEFIVVDTLVHPEEPDSVVRRWQLDAVPSVPEWKVLTLPADIENTHYSTAVGRVAGDRVDGLYTGGKVGGAGQLNYTPLFNVFSPVAPPSTRRLTLPNTEIPTALATVRLVDNTTDLFVVSDGKLYYFASSNQRNGATPTLILADGTLLGGVSRLFASSDGTTATVWGLNASNEVFYTTAPNVQMGTPSAWSIPVPIISGVDAISPYMDRKYGANTIFAHDGNDLSKNIRTPSTGMWSKRSITLPPTAFTQPPRTTSTYTTTIDVTDMTTGQRAANTKVMLTATTVTSAKINDLHYTIGPHPIELTTDLHGSITVIEEVHTLSGSRLHLTLEGGDEAGVSVNPMTAPMQRNSSYDTADKLKAATITNQYTGEKRQLLPDGTGDEATKQVAAMNKSLANAYNAHAETNNAVLQTQKLLQSRGTNPTAGEAELGGFSFIGVGAGDLFRWLKSGIEAEIRIIEDVAGGVWHFIASVAGKVYGALLDTVEAVVGALEWVYNAIKILIEDIIEFLEFLMKWKEVIETHRVVKHILLLMAQYSVDKLQTAKSDIQSAFTELKTQLDELLGRPTAGHDTSFVEIGLQSTPKMSSPANFGAHHYKAGAKHISSSAKPASGPGDVLQAFVQAVEAEGEVLGGAIERIEKEILNPFPSLSMGEVFKRLLDIIADALLDSAETVILALIDLLISVANTLVETLEHTLHIPVLSWLYHLVTGDDLSFLDLVSLIAAIAMVVTGNPFPSGDKITNNFKNAASFHELLKYMREAPSETLQLTAETGSDENGFSDMQKRYELGAGIMAFFGSIILGVTNIVADVQSPLLAIVSVCATYMYVSPSFAMYAQSDKWYAVINDIFAVIAISKSIVAVFFSGGDSGKRALALAETGISAGWMVSVIGGIAAPDAQREELLVLATVGNSFQNFAGFLTAFISDANVGAKIAQLVMMMLGYGAVMAIRGDKVSKE